MSALGEDALCAFVLVVTPLQLTSPVGSLITTVLPGSLHSLITDTEHLCATDTGLRRRGEEDTRRWGKGNNQSGTILAVFM